MLYTLMCVFLILLATGVVGIRVVHFGSALFCIVTHFPLNVNARRVFGSGVCSKSKTHPSLRTCPRAPKSTGPTATPNLHKSTVEIWRCAEGRSHKLQVRLAFLYFFFDGGLATGRPARIHMVTLLIIKPFFIIAQLHMIVMLPSI